MARKSNPKLRERLIAEAEHLIHLKGYNATSMEDIARACGMTKANLFHHFGSKEDLGLAVLDSKIADTRSCRINPLCGDPAGDPLRAVQKMFDDCSTLFKGNGCRAGCFVGNIALEMSDASEAFRKKVSLFFEEWAAGMAECLDRGRRSGLFTRDLEPKAAAETILSLYEGAIMLARTRRDASIFQRVGRQARALLERYVAN